MKTTFYNLPAELRNEIYLHALVSPTPIELPYAYENREFIEPALLSASPWIRAEALSIYYGSNIFEAPSLPAAKRFLNQLSAESIARLQTLRPIDLVLSLAAHKRWFDAFRITINRLMEEAGKGVLAADAIYIPVRTVMGEEIWATVQQIEDFVLATKNEGLWELAWREASGTEELEP